MNKLSPIKLLITAALIGILAESAWSDPATPDAGAAPAMQAPAPGSGHQPGWYPTPLNPGGYAQSWQQPSPWPAPPPAYGPLPPPYSPFGRFRPAPAVPVENPLSAELEETREQLTAQGNELDRAKASLEALHAKLEHRLDAERTLNAKVADITREQQALQAHVTELTTERERLHGALASRDTQLASVQAELQAARQALHQAQSETTLSGRELGTAMAQADTLSHTLVELNARLENQQTALQNAVQGGTGPQAQSGIPEADPRLEAARVQSEALNKELTGLKAQLEDQQTALRNSEHSLSTVVTERDGLLAEINAVIAERDGLQKELAACRRELSP